jgi:signal transduction histidine kinase
MVCPMIMATIEVREKMKCWELFDCNEQDCPVYKSREPKCWLVPGTHCRNEIQGKFLEKMEMCLECDAFQENIDLDSIERTLKVVNEQFIEFRKMIDEEERQSKAVSMELALGLSEVFEALRKISSGNPEVRIHEASGLELLSKLKQMVNLTAESLGEIVHLSHEFAIGLAEHFDTLHRVAEGDLTARISGISEVELLELLKRLTNQMISGVSQEIAERRQAEEALKRARDELEIRVEERTAELSRSNTLLKKEIAERELAEKECRTINQELNNFVNIVSHDLKTPIISIQGFSARLLKKCEKQLGKEGGKYVEQIMASARRMELFVSDLLELSRIGRVVSRFEHVSSLEVIRSVVSILEDRLKEKGIDLVVAGDPPTIYGDGPRICQVFENLLINAIKFSGSAKKPQVEIGYEDKGEYYQFYVRDNGIGIDPKYHRKVFEMFHRLNENEAEEGTGLGLTIVERIVRNHGGRIWLESEKGKGATFYFTMPIPPTPH